MSRRTCLLLLLACCLAAALAATPLATQAASSAVTVSMDVPSATIVDAAGCAPGTSGTSFGTVLPDSKVVLGAACSVSFGSSNGTARLFVGQTDRVGSAMWTPSIGEPDASFSGDGWAVVAPSAGAVTDTGEDIVVRPDGSILVVGACRSAGGGIDGCIVAFSDDGSLDTTGFGAPNGYVLARATATTGEEYFYGVALQDDGRIVTAGTCEMPVTGHGSAVWDADPACAMSDGTHWNALPAAPAHVASANPLQPAATASFRFGLRTAPDQPAGTYVAPIAFEVMAP